MRQWSVACLAVLLLAAPALAGESSPNAVAQAFGRILEEGDTDALRGLVIPDDQGLLDQLPVGSNRTVPGVSNVTVGRQGVDGGTAFAEFTINPASGNAMQMFFITYRTTDGWRIALEQTQRIAGMGTPTRLNEQQVQAYTQLAQDRRGSEPIAVGSDASSAGNASSSGSGVQLGGNASSSVVAVPLISFIKPILFIILVAVWAGVVGRLDNDAARFYLHRRLWNIAHISVGILALGLLLLIPIFIIGLLLALLLMAATIGGYIYYRQTQVPEKARWVFSLDTLTNFTDKLDKASAERNLSMRLIDADESVLEVPDRSEQTYLGHELMETLLDYALPRQADRIELLVEQESVSCASRIDGVRYPHTDIEREAALGLIEYMKGAAGLDLNEKRKKQTGPVTISAGDHGTHELRVTTAGSTRGLSLMVEIDPGQRLTKNLDKLGLTKRQLEQLRPAVQELPGVFIVGCPPRQGSTTTLYALLQEHDPYTQNVVTYEDEVAYEIVGVNHETIEPGTDNDAFNEHLQAQVRRDPSVFMLSRLADAQTAQIVAKGAEDVRFYFPVPQSDTFSTLNLWLKAVGDPRRAGEALAGIVSQRLMRKLCPTCRIAFKPDPAALKRMNLPVDKVEQLYKASGKVNDGKHEVECPDCHGLGYRGRIAVFEVMVLDDQARSLIADNQLDQLRSHLRKQKMLWLQEAALEKAMQGETDVAEIQRVLKKTDGK